MKSLTAPRTRHEKIEHDAVMLSLYILAEVERMKLEKIKVVAEQNRVKASGLEPRVLQEQWIEAIRNTQNKVIITDGRTPIILGQ